MRLSSRLERLERAIADRFTDRGADEGRQLTLEERLQGMQNILGRFAIPDPFPELLGEEKLTRTCKWFRETYGPGQ
jgi:hypothetical protein